MFEDFEFEEKKFNPWDVKSLEEFRYYCCPSCPSKNVDKTNFIKHAVTTHPESQSTIEGLEDNKAVIKSENEGNKEAHPLEKDSLLSKKAVVSLPKLSDAIIRKYTKVFEKKNFEQPKVGEVPLHLNRQKSPHENVRYDCDECDKSFSRKANLNRHIKGVHENNRYNCDRCEKSFTKKCHLTMHIQGVHDNVRYNCDMCDKSFSDKVSLNKHIQSVHENIQFNCDMTSVTKAFIKRII